MFLKPILKSIKLTILTLFLSSTVSAQTVRQQIDQLNIKASQSSYQPDSLFIYAKKAHQLAIENNYKEGEAVALRFLGEYEHIRNNYVDALKMYKKSLAMLETGKNNFEIAKTCLSIAFVYNADNDFGNSLTFGLKALKIFNELKDVKGQSKVLNLLGIACANQGDFKNAKIYFTQYNNISKKIPDSVSLAYSYNNLGSINKELRFIDSALYYYKTAAHLFNLKKYMPGLSLADRNIGGIYFEKKDFKNALVYAKKSLNTSIKSKERRLEAISLKEIGVCYRELKDTANAYLYFKKAVKLATVLNDKLVLRDTYASLAQLDDANKNYKDAYENLKASRVAHDSLLNTEKTKVIKELTTKYETDKKEKAIKSLTQESIINKLKLKERNLFLSITIGLLVIGTILSYLFYSRKKLKAKAQLQKEINKQQDIAARAVLDAEERERRRIAGDLHDGVGQMLSAALMNMNGLYKNLKLTSEEDTKAQKTLALVNESYDEMRSISHQMMPNALIKSGLASAVKEFLNKIDKDIIKINLETIGLKNRINEQTETVLYRVIQETVNNVIKHSGANKLDIVLMKDEEGVSATIEDNGKGFDKSKIKKEGIGISNIYSRVEFLKGTVDIDTSPGKGTLIAIYIPN